MADPNGFGSVGSRVIARPILYSLGTDPVLSDLVSTGPKTVAKSATST